MKRWLTLMFVCALPFMSPQRAEVGTYFKETVTALKAPNENVHISPAVTNFPPGARDRMKGRLRANDHIAIAVLPAAAAQETNGSAAEFTQMVAEALGRETILITAIGNDMEVYATGQLPQTMAKQFAADARAATPDTEVALTLIVANIHTHQDQTRQAKESTATDFSWKYLLAGAVIVALLSGAGLTLLLLRGGRYRREPVLAELADLDDIPPEDVSVTRVGDDLELLPPGDGEPEQIGPYRVIRRLGAGGMGVVYLAESSDGLQVAVKVIHPQVLQADPKFLDRFKKEVEAASRVDSPRTAKVIAANTEPPVYWLATRYIPADNLTQVVETTGVLAAEDLTKLTIGLAEALIAIHNCRVVHRDLKPANILWTPEGPVIIDFGIAQVDDATRLTRGSFIGTAGYASPEHARGQPIGPQSDVFSLGSILVYAATGNMPFGEGRAIDVLYRVVNDEPDLTGVPPGLYEIAEWCLDKKPGARPRPEQILDRLGVAV